MKYVSMYLCIVYMYVYIHIPILIHIEVISRHLFNIYRLSIICLDLLTCLSIDLIFSSIKKVLNISSPVQL